MDFFWINVGICAVLCVLLFKEARDYQKFLEAWALIQKMNPILQASLLSASGVAESVSAEQLQLRQAMSIYEQELVLVRAVLEVHSEALHVRDMTQLFKAVDELKKS